MKKHKLYGVILITILIASCNWMLGVKEEYSRMFITGSTLKLYTNNTFKEETASDMIKPDGSSELMISRGEI